VRNANANSTVDNPVGNAETALTVTARNVVPYENSFWVLYGQHDKPTFLEDAGNGQKMQRDWALTFVRQWRVCLDIGSNIGQWTRPLAHKFQSVVCFEPNPNFRECFQKNISENNVVLHPYGLSDKEHSASQDFNSTQIKDEPGDIKMRTLDSFGLTNVDLVKIDVDGFELRVVQGAVKTLTENSPVVNIELKTTWKDGIGDRRPMYSGTTELLRSLGYKRRSRVKSDEVWQKT